MNIISFGCFYFKLFNPYLGVVGYSNIYKAYRFSLGAIGPCHACDRHTDICAGKPSPEAARLMDACFASYSMTHMLGPLESAGRLPVTGGQRDSVDMCLMQELSLPLGESEAAQVVLEVPYSVNAPVYPGMHLGVARLVLHGQVFGESEIVASERVEPAGLRYNIGRVMEGWLMIRR